jgi:hypothetical protein
VLTGFVSASQGVSLIYSLLAAEAARTGFCSAFVFLQCGCRCSGCLVPLLELRFLCEFLCGSLQGDTSIALESPDQKT